MPVWILDPLGDGGNGDYRLFNEADLALPVPVTATVA